MGIEIRFRSAGLRHARQHAPRRRRARVDARRPNTTSRPAPSSPAPAASRPTPRCGRAISPAMPTSMKVRGSRHDTGEVLNVSARARRRDGRPLAIRRTCRRSTPMRPISRRRSTPTAAATPRAATIIRSASRVNALGLRFFDEGEAKHSYTYAKTGRAVLAQPGAAAYQIYDQTGIKRQQRYPHHQASLRRRRASPNSRARSGSSRRCSSHTVAEFNAACRDDVPFDPTRPDGKATIGLAIPKSNWATRIEPPPFRAYPVTGGITFTFGGVEGQPEGAGDQHDATSRSAGSTPPATLSGCSFTTTRRSPGRPAMPCSAGSPGSMPPRRTKGTHENNTIRRRSVRRIRLLISANSRSSYFRGSPDLGMRRERPPVRSRRTMPSRTRVWILPPFHGASRRCSLAGIPRAVGCNRAHPSDAGE